MTARNAVAGVAAHVKNQFGYYLIAILFGVAAASPRNSAIDLFDPTPPPQKVFVPIPRDPGDFDFSVDEIIYMYYKPTDSVPK